MIRVTAIVDDGTELADGLPEIPRTPITVVQNAFVVLRATVIGRSGLAADVTPSELVLRVYPAKAGAEPVLRVIGDAPVEPADGNVAEFTFSESSLRDVRPGRYLYDVILDANTGRQQIVWPSAFIVVGSPT